MKTEDATTKLTVTLLQTDRRMLKSMAADRGETMGELITRLIHSERERSAQVTA